MDSRQQQLETWLAMRLPEAAFTLTPASADASFRRYFRVHLQPERLIENVAYRTLIAMDAPPLQEDCTPFIHVAQLLLKAGLNVPQIVAHNIKEGFLLLTDLGDVTYLSQLNKDSAPGLYLEAIKALVKLQVSSEESVLPNYDAALLSREMQLFPDWYITKHLKVTLDDKELATLISAFELLNQNILAQAQVYVHRDYHSRNLMVCNAATGFDASQNPGVLDFQDAVYGAITYDLVSLLKDAYIEWDEEEIIDWAVRYWQEAKKAKLPVPADFSTFYRDFEYMGAQRHLKILGIFARLYHRDGKDGYLKAMPLVMHYLRKVCQRYIELKPMLRLLDKLENTHLQIAYTF